MKFFYLLSVSCILFSSHVLSNGQPPIDGHPDTCADKSLELSTSAEFEQYVFGRHHRLHHLIWHRLRSYWDVYPERIKQQVRDLGWEPPRPSPEYTPPHKVSESALLNGSGEDFLFFHRKMLLTYRALVKYSDYEDVSTRWVSIPRPGSDAFPVPPAWEIPDQKAVERMYKQVKSDGYYWSRIHEWENQFKNPLYLRSLSLGEFGAQIERSIHRALHRRWATKITDPKTGKFMPLGRDMDDIDPKWDTRSYNALQDFYSAQANPIFWALHGWIDARIDDWFTAHAHYHPGEVAKTTINGIPWFEKGKWVALDNHWIWPISMAKETHVETNTRHLASMEVVIDITSKASIVKFTQQE